MIDKHSHALHIHASDSCLMLDYVRIINFRIIIIIIIIYFFSPQAQSRRQEN